MRKALREMAERAQIPYQDTEYRKNTEETSPLPG